MDKYEYSIKAEKLKKLVEKKDYVTAARLADTIDWHRVKNMRMLSMVALVYEKVERYGDAKEILLQAYELAPTGRRLLYKLTEISVKEREFEDAELFYREYSEAAPDDLGRYILRFIMLSGKGESLDKQISILEAYRQREFDEKWAFELAKLYHKAGRVQDCVKLCDEIILWFSCGRYVDRAMELKTIYQPLTAEQQEKADNKEEYEKRLLEFEKAEEKAAPKSVVTRVQGPRLVKPASRPQEEPKTETAETKEAEELPVIQIPKVVLEEEEPAPEAEEDMPKEAALEEETAEAEEAPEEEQVSEESTLEEETEAALREALEAVTREAAATFEPEPEEPDLEEPKPEELETEEPKISEAPQIIRAFSLRKEPGAVELAIEKLKEIHEMLETPVKKVARITGEKLNQVGLLASLDRLADADLIITDAERLNDTIKQEIEAVVTADTNTMVIILIEEEQEEELPVIQIPEITLEEIEEEPKKTPKKEAPKKETPQKETPKKTAPKKASKEFNEDEFVAFVKDYADQLECILDDMAELAVYAAAEELLEDGILLDEESAKDLTEEAVERAEKRGLRALFGSRYDKEGRLILRESHFKL